MTRRKVGTEKEFGRNRDLKILRCIERGKEEIKSVPNPILKNGS